MSVRMKGRRRQVARLVDLAQAWAQERRDVAALLVVGSYAYGRPRMSSDVDLVLVAEERDRLLTDLTFVADLTRGGRVILRRDWGPMHECRVRMASGLHVEFGVTGPDWLDVPVDPGTARVLSDGCRIVLDRGPAKAALTSLGLPIEHW